MRWLNLKRFALLALLLPLSALGTPDNLIGDGRSGSFQLLDNNGLRWNTELLYTTNGVGDVITLGGLTASSDNVIGDLLSGNHQLIDNSNKRWDIKVTYTTDGAGNVIPVPAGSSGGITLLNGLSTGTQIFATGTTGSDFNVVSSGDTHTFNFPNASASHRGLLSTTDWSAFTGSITTLSAATALDTASTIVKRNSSGDFSAGKILDSAGTPKTSVDIQNRTLNDSNGTIRVNYGSGNIYDVGGALSVHSSNRFAADSGENVSISWQARACYAPNSTIEFEWDNTGVKFPALTVSTVPYLDASGYLKSSAVTPTQLGYVDATSSIQTQLNGKQSSGNYLTGITGDAIATGPGSANALISNRALDRYIDATNGSDSTGTGSQLRPWKSLNYAYSQVTDATRYNQYIFHLSGGEDTADVDPITAKPDISLTSDAPFLILESFTISGTDGLNTGSEPFSVNNVLFLSSFSWESNDTRALVMYATNTTFAGGSSIRQENAGGVLTVNFLNCLFEGSTNEFQVSSGVFASSVFVASNTTFDDGTGFLEIFGGYNASAFTLIGGVTSLMSGIPCDAGNGCTMIFTTTGSGTPAVFTDSSSIPPTYTGSPTIGLTSNAVNEGYTPTTSTNWSTVPTTVKGALDHLVVTQQSAVGSQPACASGKRGLQWLIQSTAGVADIFQICQQTIGGYAWVTH